ncbi:MAG: T9SS type A sorting domain-containing protein [Bacteroidaceae bacterium]|nr:T9SS type A sorting domain-containing protein [Bacteroidaceae bacterium]
MKKILLILAVIFSLPTFADHHLVIEINDSKQHSYSLSDKPVITFDNDRLFIKTDKIEIDYPISNIVKYYFIELDETGVEDIKNDVDNINFIYTNPDFLCVEGINGDADINIYDISGRVCAVNSTKSDNCMKIELNTLKKGVYIIKVNNHSFKITR